MSKLSNVASFDVDPQKTFTPQCPDELPVPEGDQIVDELNNNAELAVYRVGSRDVHAKNAIWIAEKPEDMLNPVDGDNENVDVQWNSHAMLGTKGFELLDGLPHPVTGYDFFVNKGIDPDCHPYGACYHDLADTKTTGVIEFLESRGVEHVIVGGLALDYCVAKTVTQLCEAGFSVLVNLAACRGIAPESTEKAIAEMKAANAYMFRDSKAISEYLQ